MRGVAFAKLVILVLIPFLASFILAFRVALVAKLVISGILSWVFFILALYKSTLTSFLTHVGYLNQQDQVLIYQHLIYLTHFSKCLNWLVQFIYIRFYLAKSTFFENFDISTSVASLNLLLLQN